jgi:hypothetical protein
MVSKYFSLKKEVYSRSRKHRCMAHVDAPTQATRRCAPCEHQLTRGCCTQQENRTARWSVRCLYVGRRVRVVMLRALAFSLCACQHQPGQRRAHELVRQAAGPDLRWCCCWGTCSRADSMQPQLKNQPVHTQGIKADRGTAYVTSTSPGAGPQLCPEGHAAIADSSR